MKQNDLMMHMTFLHSLNGLPACQPWVCKEKKNTKKRVKNNNNGANVLTLVEYAFAILWPEKGGTESGVRDPRQMPAAQPWRS